MKLTVIKQKDYNPNLGVVKNGRPVCQFIASNDTPFAQLLKPTKVEVSNKKEQSLLDLALSEDIELDTVIEAEEENNSFEVEAETRSFFKANKSVVGIGVSDIEYSLHKEDLMKCGCTVFIYYDVRNLDLVALKEFIESKLSPTLKAYHVLHLNLKPYAMKKLRVFLKEYNYKNVRLIGDSVVKLQGLMFGGLFTKSFVTRFNLEFDYLDNVHPVTQVALTSVDLVSKPIDEIEYKYTSTNSKKSSKQKHGTASTSKTKEKTNKPSKPKRPAKKKVNRRALFG
jgi:hypothetical protein